MPPANSPTEPPRRTTLDATATPLRSPSPNTLLPGLRELASPVLDLASTLTVEAEDGIDADNVSFLRRPAEEEISGEALTRELRHNERRRLRESQQHRDRTQADLRRLADDETRERRLHQRRMAQLRAQLDPRWAVQDRNRQHSPYGGQAPSQQSLYDWAPNQHEGEAEELEDILAELRAQQPNTHPELLQSLGLSQLEREARNRLRTEMAPAAPTHEPSLRSSAILQSIRRNHRISPRSRNMMENHIRDRVQELDRTSHGSSDRLRNLDLQRQSSLSRATPADSERLPAAAEAGQASESSHNPSSRHASARPTSSNNRQRSSDSMAHIARHYLEDPRGMSDRCTRFERAIRTLHWLLLPDREVQDLDVAEKLAEDNRLSPKLMRQELYISLLEGVGPYYTSWLAPGSIFIGSQSACPHSSSHGSPYRLANNEVSASSASAVGSGRWSVERGGPLLHFNLPHQSVAGSTSSSPQDRWTVKVTVHAVDWERMTLQGTMEAFDVPSVSQASSSGRRNPLPPHTAERDALTRASFSTFLEGELIDFRQHTLLTVTETFKSTKANASTDSMYWRKLEPFVGMHDDQISSALANPKWIEEELNGRYILMRWKERCFVKATLSSASLPADESALDASNTLATTQEPERSPLVLHNVDGNGYGLSISGFYYVSLRRRDGQVTGLYYDPQSSPYQHLELGPMSSRHSAGTWSLR